MSAALAAAGVLGGTFFLGVPLNGGTVLIFLKRKKLRHLVNFLLLLDSLSHLLVTFLIIPSRLVSTVVFDNFESLDEREDLIGDFANTHGTLLTLSIGILRYRRLCWKKKDGFSLLNGIKWSLGTSILAFGLTATQFTTSHFYLVQDGGKRLNLIFYTVKTCLSITSVFFVVWCYTCVCWRVLGNSSNQEKLRRSRSVHIRAMVHSVIQILLLVSTISFFIYTETLQLRQMTTSGSQKLNLLYGTTANYALLVTGTPLAYLASCHRFREEFTTLFFGTVSRSFFQKISNDKKESCRPKSSHLMMTSSSSCKNEAKHKILIRRPSTPRTTTSSSTSSTAVVSHSNRIGSVTKPTPLHHLPATIEIRTDLTSNSIHLPPLMRKGSTGHVNCPCHRSPKNTLQII